MIFYNGVDITNSVHPLVLQITDNAGCVPDSLTAVFSDTEGLWSKWRPAKNDTLQVKEGGFDSGVMFIDQIGQEPGRFELKALSIPQTSKTARSQAWEDVRLFDIGREIAARYGFAFRTFGAANQLYERVDQLDEPDFAFFSYRCMLEGYALKISDRSMIVYDEHLEEQKAADPAGTIRESDLNGDFRFDDKSVDIYQKCIVRSQFDGYIEGSFEDASISGPALKKNEYATNQAEANRWARGLLRGCNKHRVTGTLPINLNTSYAAGTVIEVRDVGMFDGKYFVHRIVHDLVGNRTRLTVRKPLEGY